MMFSVLTLYESFNYVEGVIWLFVAVCLLFVFRPSGSRQKVAIVMASFAFLLFGLTDFLEAPLDGVLPWWLWVMKIGCGALILGSRFTYIGWHQFRVTDRYFQFGVFCLVSVICILIAPHFIQWIHTR